MHPEDKLNKLKNILELLQRDTISPTQLKEFLDNLVKVIAKIKTDTESISSKTIKEFTDIGEKILAQLIAKQEAITEKTTNHLNDVNSSVLDTTAQVKETTKNIVEVKKLLADIKKIKTTPGKDGKDGVDGQDGKDADEKQIIKEVLKSIEIPEIQGADIVEKINALSLEDDKKIDASHIKNLPKTIGGNGSRYYYQLLDVDMTGITDGQVPTWDNANQRWIPGTGGGGSQTLEDVLTTGNTTGGIPIKVEGPLLGIPENYAFESDGYALYYTNGASTREQIAYISNIPTPGTYRSIFNFTILDDGSVLANGTNTDYAYFIQDLVGVTMPSCVGNTNRYTIKNVGSADVTINAAGGETIEGGSTAVLTASSLDSIDLISDGISNWNVV